MTGAEQGAGHPARVDATLVVGGRFHDFDHARLQLLGLLAEHDDVRTAVAADYEDVPLGDVLVSYTCDVRPSEAAQARVREWVEGGGRWFALHGTNSALDFTPDGVASPRVFPMWAETLGSQFVTHPPIAPYTVTASDPDHPLVAGIGDFSTDDELYLSEYHDRESLVPLLETRWTGHAKGFVEADWTVDEPRLVEYLRPLGQGEVLYLTLGHCRGHHDMRPLTDWYPVVERGSWAIPAYTELLRRGLAWAVLGGSERTPIGRTPIGRTPIGRTPIGRTPIGGTA